MLEILNLIRLILYLRHVDWQVVVDWRFEVCSSVMLTNSLQKFQKSVSVIWLHINKLAVICIFGWQLSANAPQTVDNKWSTSMCYTANKCNSYLNTLNVGGSYLHFWLTVLHHRQLTTNDQLICVTQPLWEESYFSLPNLIYKPPNIIGPFYLIAAVHLYCFFSSKYIRKAIKSFTSWIFWAAQDASHQQCPASRTRSIYIAKKVHWHRFTF